MLRRSHWVAQLYEDQCSTFDDSGYDSIQCRDDFGRDQHDSFAYPIDFIPKNVVISSLGIFAYTRSCSVPNHSLALVVPMAVCVYATQAILDLGHPLVTFYAHHSSITHPSLAPSTHHPHHICVSCSSSQSCIDEPITNNCHPPIIEQPPPARSSRHTTLVQAGGSSAQIPGHHTHPRMARLRLRRVIELWRIAKRENHIRL